MINFGKMLQFGSQSFSLIIMIQWVSESSIMRGCTFLFIVVSTSKKDVYCSLDRPQYGATRRVWHGPGRWLVEGPQSHSQLREWPSIGTPGSQVYTLRPSVDTTYPAPSKWSGLCRRVLCVYSLTCMRWLMMNPLLFQMRCRSSERS